MHRLLARLRSKVIIIWFSGYWDTGSRNLCKPVIFLVRQELIPIDSSFIRIENSDGGAKITGFRDNSLKGS